MNILARLAKIIEGERVVINENENMFFKEVHDFIEHPGREEFIIL